MIVLVAELDQQVSRLLFEDLPVLFGEDVLPVPGDALPEERGGVFPAPLPALRQLLEAGRAYAFFHDLLARVRPQETEQASDLRFRLLQEVFVPDFRVVG